jgi:putative sporulation protein YyaC
MEDITFDKNKTQIFVCIGTMRAKADSIAPRIGSILSNNGFKVIGTEDKPLHGLNLNERYKEEIERFMSKPKYEVVAIDCCRFKDRDIKYKKISSIIPRYAIDNSLKHIEFKDNCIGINSFSICPIIDDISYITNSTWTLIQIAELADESIYIDFAKDIANDIINKLKENKEEQVC